MQSYRPSSPLQGGKNVANESSPNKPRDLTVSAQLNGQSIKALVDTGAAISVIDKEVLQDVYEDQLPQLQIDNLGDVKTVSGEALPVLGVFTTPLDIANGSYSCTFLVVQDLPYDALLGRDFLRENGAIINLKESTLQLDGKRDEPYPERELAQGLSCDQSPVQPTRRKEFTEEHSATKKTPIKQSRASRKRALPSAFIGTLFFPSARSDDPNVPQESSCLAQQIPATRHSGKTNVSRLLIRQSLLTTLCIALYVLTASRATLPDENVYKVQMIPRIPAKQEQAFDIRSAASVPVQVCPTNPKEPYKIGQVNDESQATVRKPPQPVTQKITKKFPPMTSSDADFPASPVYDVPRSSSPLKHELFSQEISHVNPLHSDMSTVKREIHARNAYSVLVKQPPSHPKRTYFSLDRLVFDRYLCSKIPFQVISL